MLKSFKVRWALGCALALLIGVNLWGQGIFATLTGVVSDPTGAIVKGAKVTLTDAVSGSVRDTETNGDGYYTFASVPVGKYNITIEAQGFQNYKASGFDLGGAEKRNLNVTLLVGSTSQTVEVSAEAAQLVTTDSAEKSYTLNTDALQKMIQVGSDAAEYIKVMPGFAVQNGTSNKANYTGEVIGINANGDAGSQSPLNNASTYNGLPSNSLDITMDGAHVADPGCNCDTPVNPNSDFLQEFRVLAGNFSAENQKGPIVITSVTKAGGTQFHGSGFFSARNYELNANDWLNNFNNQPKPANKYYYPGGTIGGPVPKTHNKLFFFAGFEYFYQVLDTGLLRATVPTAGMLGGNFSTSELEKIGWQNPSATTKGHWSTASGGPVGSDCNAADPNAVNIPCLSPAALAAFGGTPDGRGGYNVQIPTGYLNQNMLALMKLYPAANADPNATQGYNYVQSEIFNQNNTQFNTREDYNISDSTKLFVRYNYQKETQQFPVGLWWRNGAQVPYPTAIEGKNRSQSVSGSLTHVFSPTMTNETVVAYTEVLFPNVFANPAKVNRGNVGYNVQGIFNNGVTQIPSFGSFGGETALIFNPGGFEAGGASQGLYANKYMPEISDTVTKVIGTHTLKGGFFWEWIRNAQPANNDTNGQWQFVAGNNSLYSTGDSYSDEILGIASHYDEATKNRINDIAYNTYEFFVQDDWKATKRLTVNLGLRFSHIQPWYDRLGFGFSVFNQAAYTAGGGASCTGAPTFCGYEWHTKNSSVPLGGYPTRSLFYQPRLGAAYDLFGNGKTIVRGGWGRYYFHVGQFTNGLDASAGVKSIGYDGKISTSTTASQPILVNPLPAALAGMAPWNTSSSNVGVSNVSNQTWFSATPATPSAVDGSDNEMGYTDTWNLTVSHQLPWSSMFELSYIGNRSQDLASSGNGGSVGINTLNINPIPVGAMLASANGGVDPNTLNSAAFRPIQGYGDLYVASNNGHANYNGLQAIWARTKGRYSMNLNYTFSKSEQILGNNGNLIDQLDVNRNFGVAPNSRKHLFNAVYSVDLPKANINKWAGGVINGWQVTGIIQVQSGPNLTGYQNQNFGMSYAGANGTSGSSAIIPGSKSAQNPDGIAITNVSLLGTPDIQLNPVVTCNPASGLKAHQYINPNCFAPPTAVGQNGPIILPAIYGPAYFNWDMGLFKNFNITERQNLQFRFNLYNWMNHPLWSFNGGNLNLSYTQDAAAGTVTQNNSNFGITTQKQGHRIIEMGMKYTF
ncbi:MAG TPA: carboxypeptidase-like regulatory domain-containing protein [Candidatus Sulfotelmatobacter sp.]|nr:carboxypeptidase-like regulatory domain-containing protein [Candidatus Sulfotelmatobacter sp.]